MFSRCVVYACIPIKSIMSLLDSDQNNTFSFYDFLYIILISESECRAVSVYKPVFDLTLNKADIHVICKGKGEKCVFKRHLWVCGIHRITINVRCYMLVLWLRRVTVRSHMQNLTHPRAPTSC